ncbi:DUF1493 family protein [Pantoea ananatis]
MCTNHFINTLCVCLLCFYSLFFIGEYWFNDHFHPRNAREAIPLRIAMLIESARAGRWLFS